MACLNAFSSCGLNLIAISIAPTSAIPRHDIYSMYVIPEMNYARRYERFISDEALKIERVFSEHGYQVEDESDNATYDGWIDKGRKVKTGEKGVKVISSKPQAKPLYAGSSPIVDKKTGKQKFACYPISFVLFHVKQTEPLKT